MSLNAKFRSDDVKRTTLPEILTDSSPPVDNFNEKYSDSPFGTNGGGDGGVPPFEGVGFGVLFFGFLGVRVEPTFGPGFPFGGA
jgi:hypothetical protein